MTSKQLLPLYPARQSSFSSESDEWILWIMFGMSMDAPVLYDVLSSAPTVWHMMQ